MNQQPRNISLSRLSQDIGVSKTSIHRRCTELGINTSSGRSAWIMAIAPYFLPVAGGYFSSNLTRTACSIKNAARLAVGRPS